MEIQINNVKLYYEEYGSGQPIILLHGNQETIHNIDFTEIEDEKRKNIDLEYFEWNKYCDLAEKIIKCIQVY